MIPQSAVVRERHDREGAVPVARPHRHATSRMTGCTAHLRCRLRTTGWLEKLLSPPQVFLSHGIRPGMVRDHHRCRQIPTSHALALQLATPRRTRNMAVHKHEQGSCMLYASREKD